MAIPLVEVRAKEPIPMADAKALAILLQTLGDPTRLRIITALETACVCVGAIVDATGLPQSTVSHHLRILRDRGLVYAERRGAFIYYCLTTDGLRDALDALGTLMPTTTRR